MNSAPTEVEEAVGRVRAFLAEWPKARQRDPHEIYGLHIGDAREAILTTADLRLILSDYARLQSESANMKARLARWEPSLMTSSASSSTRLAARKGAGE